MFPELTDGKHEFPTVDPMAINNWVRAKTQFFPLYLPSPFTIGEARNAIDNTGLFAHTPIMEYMMRFASPVYIKEMSIQTNRNFYDYCKYVDIPESLQHQAGIAHYAYTPADIPVIYTTQIGLIFLYTDNPLYYSIRNGRLHSETGHAIQLRNGKGLFFLNGVRVPEYLATHDKDKINPVNLEHISDPAVRSQFVKKVGMLCCYKYLPNWEIQENYNGYTLWRILVTSQYESWLLMLNPSTGERHMEAVPPDCVEVQQALNWRAYGDRRGKLVDIKAVATDSFTYKHYINWSPNRIS